MTRPSYSPISGRVGLTVGATAGRVALCTTTPLPTPIDTCCGWFKQPPDYPLPSPPFYGIITGGPWDGWVVEFYSVGTGALNACSPIAGGVLMEGQLRAPYHEMFCDDEFPTPGAFKLLGYLMGTTITNPPYQDQERYCDCPTYSPLYGEFVSAAFGAEPSHSWSIRDIQCDYICPYTLNGVRYGYVDVDVVLTNAVPLICSDCADQSAIYRCFNTFGPEVCNSFEVVGDDFCVQPNPDFTRRLNVSVSFTYVGTKYDPTAQFAINGTITIGEYFQGNSEGRNTFATYRYLDDKPITTGSYVLSRTGGGSNPPGLDPHCEYPASITVTV